MKLNLDAFVTEPDTIQFRGVEYLIPGDIPLPMILEATQIEQALRSEKDALDEALRAGDVEKIQEIGARQMPVLSRLQALVMKLFKIENPDVPELDLTSTECGRILALIVSGGLSSDIDEAVLEAIAGPKEERATSESRPPTRKTASRSRSAKRSPNRSSG